MSGCPHAGGHRSNSDLDLSSVALASPFAAQYGECKRVVNMTCERMRASRTLSVLATWCRFGRPMEMTNRRSASSNGQSIS